MITVPVDVRCNFCAKTFCCLKCRVNHEKNVHQDEINNKIREEYMKTVCFICRGEEFPLKINEMLSSELIQHISEQHLPLKCNKCSKVFENINDFQLIGKCCSIEPSENDQIINENMGEELIEEKRSKTDSEVLTPLTKINLRWRRKSKEFIHNKTEDMSHVKQEEEIPKNQLKRQTSTPMQGNFDSLSSMQFSSINCVSSSSEHDYSPPLPPKQPALVALSPKSNNKKKGNSPLSKSRAKIAAQNTPLRQVMTKSIQRAMATHGHYKHVHLQQRKMTFDSSSSSNEPTMSLMKLHVETEEFEVNSQPLDLRLSPALRRNNGSEEEKFEQIVEEIKSEANDHVEYEEIRVILRRSESESSISSSYKSCYSDISTPRNSSSNILKKTISFEEQPGIIDKTPGFLVPYENDDDFCTSDVFYTPRSTPMRRVKSLEFIDTDSHDYSQKPEANSSSNIWSFVTSVMGSFVTGSKHDESVNESKRKWGFSFNKPLQAAANYFGGKYSEESDENNNTSKSSSEDDSEIFSQKRSRATITSPNEESQHAAPSAITSPICKRRKIQGRKPIDRMRNLL